MEKIFKKITNSENETLSFGEQLSRLLEPGDVIALFGDLGSGKTCLTRGICRGQNCEKEVSSPTFTIINEYLGKFPIYHFDFYRIDSEYEIYDLGYEEYFYGQGICLIEWAERAESLLPKNLINIVFAPDFSEGKEDTRKIEVTVKGEKLLNRQWNTIFSDT